MTLLSDTAVQPHPSASSVEELPTELLVFIFKHLLVPDSEARSEFFSVHQRLPERTSHPVIISLVCKRWKDVIYDIPACWSYIKVEEPLRVSDEAFDHYKTTGTLPDNCLDHNPSLKAALIRTQSHPTLVVDLFVDSDAWRKEFMLRELLLRSLLDNRVWDCLNPHWNRVVDFGIVFDSRLLLSAAPWRMWSDIIPPDRSNLQWVYVCPFTDGFTHIPSSGKLHMFTLSEDDPAMIVKGWRHVLQRAIIESGRSGRSTTQLEIYEEIFKNVENFEMNQELLTFSKIGKVFGKISGTKILPNNNNYRWKERAFDLVHEWSTKLKLYAE